MELTPVRRNFPSTVTVLAVDSDIEHLLTLTRLLHFFDYQVVTCQTATGALSLLRKRTNEFQILLADVALPDIDGFDLLTVATSEFPALQVVLFSDAGYETSAVRALELGACAFYTKPIPSDVVEHVWQHVFNRKVEPLPPPPLPIGSPIGPAPKRKRDDSDLNSSAIIQGKEGKRLKSVKNAAGLRKPRVWSPELHSKFLAAVKLTGADNITSGKILKSMEQMGVVGLRESQVSSHLQQYRKTLLLSESELSEPSSSSSYKETSSPQNQTTPSTTAAATEFYLSDQLPDITSTDYTTFPQSSQGTSSYRGGVVELGGEDFDWCLNLDSSFLENELGSISNLLACC